MNYFKFKFITWDDMSWVRFVLNHFSNKEAWFILNNIFGRKSQGKNELVMIVAPLFL